MLTDCAYANWSVQLLHISESEYKVLTYRSDANADQFSFYTFQRVSISADITCRCECWSVQLLNVSESEYKRMTDCADA